MRIFAHPAGNTAFDGHMHRKKDASEFSKASHNTHISCMELHLPCKNAKSPRISGALLRLTTILTS